jgi:NADH:ubiquinone oxidoreductase subunit F (NADH-binding)
MSQTLQQLAVPGAPAELVAEVDRLRRLVHGRGACAHPDGTARFVASTMRIFAEHVEDHLRGECHARPRRLDEV